MNRIWCGYYDGNEKSRRVQEKLGFVYQRKTEGIEVSLLGEIRTGHSNLMTKERWQKVELFRQQRKVLDTFLQNGAISRAQYNKSFGDLVELMGMQGVESYTEKRNGKRTDARPHFSGREYVDAAKPPKAMS